MFKVVRETCIAGAVIDMTIKGSNHIKGSCRAPRRNETPKAVQENNDRIAAKELTRLLNNNFYPGDYHATFTYAGQEPTQEEAKRELKNFLSRMRREFAREGKEFKYVAVTEFKNHRIHHHVVMNFIESQKVQDQWKRGLVRFTPLDKTRNYRKLANYLIKETTKTFREVGNVYKKRYTASRNLERPVIVREEVTASMLFKDPKPLKGYVIDEDSVRRFENPITGLEHLEFCMVSTEYVPRLKKWRSGTVIKRSEAYTRFEEYRQSKLDEYAGWELL